MTGFLTCALLLCTAAPSAVPPADAPRPCSVRELNEIRFSSKATGLLLATGVVQSVHDDPFRAAVVLEADGWRTKLAQTNSIPLPKPGDRIAVTCRKIFQDDHDKKLEVEAVKVLGQGPLSPPIRISLGDLDARRHDLFRVITEGTVVDVFPDDVDARYCIWLLKDGPAQVPLFVPVPIARERWIGARIRVTADYERLIGGVRRFSRPSLVTRQSGIERLTPPADPFAAPTLDPGDYLTAQEVRAMDRRTLEGVVLATWNGNCILLRVGDILSHVQLRHGCELPSVRARIKASGYPETDLFRIILTDAEWRLQSDVPEPDEEVLAVSITEITRDKSMNRQLSGPSHGKLIRLTGTVRSFSPVERAARRFLLESDGEPVPVDFSACPAVADGLIPGSRVAVTGRCLLAVDSDGGRRTFPQVTGVTLLMRTPADLTVISSPGWWTPGRLLGLIAILTALLTAIAIWNRILNRLVIRRGRQLYRADIARASEALRVEERTRLAVELHDSLSQNLTGVALQINAGRNELAARALRSCRDELRNCLWDLRNNAIDCASMDEAIRQTLAPHAEDITLNVRFNVPRAALSDNTAYAILRIVRELVVNAIRHGGASTVRVAGSLEPERLLFSVRDDGCGFDPKNRPGIGEGHFGLQGVCERVATLGGTVKIESEIGTGTKATVVIPNTTPSLQPGT